MIMTIIKHLTTTTTTTKQYKHQSHTLSYYKNDGGFGGGGGGRYFSKYNLLFISFIFIFYLSSQVRVVVCIPLDISTSSEEHDDEGKQQQQQQIEIFPELYSSPSIQQQQQHAMQQQEIPQFLDEQQFKKNSLQKWVHDYGGPTIPHHIRTPPLRYLYQNNGNPPIEQQYNGLNPKLKFGRQGGGGGRGTTDQQHLWNSFHDNKNEIGGIIDEIDGNKLLNDGKWEEWELELDPTYYIHTTKESPSINNIQQRKRRNAGPSLSIVNPLDVLRQRLLIEIARRRLHSKNQQITANTEYLRTIGRRRR